MDKYDEQIARLLAAPDFKVAAHCDWNYGIGLFQYATLTGKDHWGRHGCLTMIKSADCIAWTEGLTQAIRDDPRIPSDEADITPKSLPVFAEWQRRIDREIRQPNPPSEQEK